jgi:hypothetical protein
LCENETSRFEKPQTRDKKARGTGPEDYPTEMSSLQPNVIKNGKFQFAAYRTETKYR